MRKWTMSACVVLSWSVIVPLLAAAGLAVPARHAQENTTTSITQITLARTPVRQHPNAILTAEFPGGPQPRHPAPDTAGGPSRLAVILITVGVLAAIAIALEPASAFIRRRLRARRTATSPVPAGQQPAPTSAPAAKTRVIHADHERLIVTYSIQDHTIYVLTPPGEDPRTVLRAARLILPEDSYADLADHLGVPSTD